MPMRMRICALTSIIGLLTCVAHAQDWVETLRTARANYHDTDGNQVTVARWGDSITPGFPRWTLQSRLQSGVVWPYECRVF
jgi:hypothetical protein